MLGINKQANHNNLKIANIYSTMLVGGPVLITWCPNGVGSSLLTIQRHNNPKIHIIQLYIKDMITLPAQALAQRRIFPW